MDHIQAVKTQLDLLGYPYSQVNLLQDEEDVLVARAVSTGGQAVLKVYLAPEYRREIANYRLLAELGVPTLRVLGATEMSLLLEDVDISLSLRLGREEDLASPKAGTLIARWYKRLHDQGRTYLHNHPDAALYQEIEALTAENLRLVQDRTGAPSLAVWALLEEKLPDIRRAVESLVPTLNYNDFYYTNLIMARDGSSAMMYDYDLLGQGYAWADVRNVCSSLEPEAKAAFLREYGSTDPQEKLVDDVVCPLTTLYAACKEKSFPKWAQSSLDCLQGKMTESLRKLLAGSW